MRLFKTIVEHANKRRWSDSMNTAPKRALFVLQVVLNWTVVFCSNRFCLWSLVKCGPRVQSCWKSSAIYSSKTSCQCIDTSMNYVNKNGLVTLSLSLRATSQSIDCSSSDLCTLYMSLSKTRERDQALYSPYLRFLVEKVVLHNDLDTSQSSIRKDLFVFLQTELEQLKNSNHFSVIENFLCALNCWSFKYLLDMPEEVVELAHGLLPSLIEIWRRKCSDKLKVKTHATNLSRETLAGFSDGSHQIRSITNESSPSESSTTWPVWWSLDGKSISNHMPSSCFGV